MSRGRVLAVRWPRPDDGELDATSLDPSALAMLGFALLRSGLPRPAHAGVVLVVTDGTPVGVVARADYVAELRDDGLVDLGDELERRPPGCLAVCIADSPTVAGVVVLPVSPARALQAALRGGLRR